MKIERSVCYKVTDNTGTVLLADTGGKYVNYRVEQRGKN